MRALLTGLVACAALAAAGCGGGDGGGGAGLIQSTGAEIAPANATFVSVDSNVDSEQWNTAETLLDKFPGKPDLLAALRSGLRTEDADWERDVKPALGERVDFVLLTVAGEVGYVGLTKPKDSAAFNALLEKGDEPAVHAEVEAWTVFSDQQASIDAFNRERAKGTLEDDDAYGAAIDSLPEESLLMVYANGTQAAAQLRQQLDDSGAGALLSGDQLSWAAVAFEAVSNGLRIVGSAKGEAVDTIENYSPKLLEHVPSDALAALSFRGGGKQLSRQLERIPGMQGQLSQLEQVLGVPLENVTGLFSGEGLAYVVEAAPIPEFTVLLEQSNAAEAVTTIDRIVGRAGILFGMQPTTSTVDGVTVKTLKFDSVSVSYAGVDGKLVITTDKAAISGLGDASGDALADDPDFKRASEAAELGDETSGFLYVNLREAIALGRRFAEAADETIPPDVDSNLRPLESFLVHGSREGDETHFTGFLEIE